MVVWGRPLLHDRPQAAARDDGRGPTPQQGRTCQAGELDDYAAHRCDQRSGSRHADASRLRQPSPADRVRLVVVDPAEGPKEAASVMRRDATAPVLFDFGAPARHGHARQGPAPLPPPHRRGTRQNSRSRVYPRQHGRRAGRCAEPAAPSQAPPPRCRWRARRRGEAPNRTLGSRPRFDGRHRTHGARSGATYPCRRRRGRSWAQDESGGGPEISRSETRTGSKRRGGPNFGRRWRGPQPEG
mmetsp:Transcript_100131/g.286326  ORF Transcript_100131/g.286326 Transcript_100131/m.286326 type:complete len:242 (-) Transcript_100131:308-1033(-)